MQTRDKRNGYRIPTRNYRLGTKANRAGDGIFGIRNQAVGEFLFNDGAQLGYERQRTAAEADKARGFVVEGTLANMRATEQHLGDFDRAAAGDVEGEGLGCKIARGVRSIFIGVGVLARGAVGRAALLGEIGAGAGLAGDVA